MVYIAFCFYFYLLNNFLAAGCLDLEIFYVIFAKFVDILLKTALFVNCLGWVLLPNFLPADECKIILLNITLKG